MKKIIRIVFVLSGFMLAILCILSVLICYTYVRRSAMLEDQINEMVKDYKEGRAQDIDLSSINYFAWDEVYLVGGYSSCDDVANAVKVPTYKFLCSLTGIQYDEDATLFVFKYKNRVVRDVKYFGRSYRHKCDPNTYLPYSPKDAKFVFDKNGDFICVAKEVK